MWESIHHHSLTRKNVNYGYNKKKHFFICHFGKAPNVYSTITYSVWRRALLCFTTWVLSSTYRNACTHADCRHSTRREVWEAEVEELAGLWSSFLPLPTITWKSMGSRAQKVLVEFGTTSWWERQTPSSTDGGGSHRNVERESGAEGASLAPPHIPVIVRTESFGRTWCNILRDLKR